MRFRWSVGTVLGFLFNAHNKKVRKHMVIFAESVNASNLFPNLAVRYSMKTEKISVSSGDGTSGASLETYHKLIFSRS